MATETLAAETGENLLDGAPATLSYGVDVVPVPIGTFRFSIGRCCCSTTECVYPDLYICDVDDFDFTVQDSTVFTFYDEGVSRNATRYTVRASCTSDPGSFEDFEIEVACDVIECKSLDLSALVLVPCGSPGVIVYGNTDTCCDSPPPACLVPCTICTGNINGWSSPPYTIGGCDWLGQGGGSLTNERGHRSPLDFTTKTKQVITWDIALNDDVLLEDNIVAHVENAYNRGGFSGNAQFGTRVTITSINGVNTWQANLFAAFGGLEPLTSASGSITDPTVDIIQERTINSIVAGGAGFNCPVQINETFKVTINGTVELNETRTWDSGFFENNTGCNFWVDLKAVYSGADRDLGLSWPYRVGTITVVNT